ncbi:hypothetical protein ACJ73_07629 [Blastomyces percursus]|uniref:Peptidase A2 domain-containing protein n=1 Tax=Blastomyces percursus TaxID=1658174 RepID=A0A1J9QXW6_9EURO|nr:hypothetical protein ACJ73_07629 [Blastomyces percursus]
MFSTFPLETISISQDLSLGSRLFPEEGRSSDYRIDRIRRQPGKRAGLREVSFSGGRVTLGVLDLSKLIGGKPFIVSNKIAFNGCAIPIKSLVDSGANGYIFIDTRLACDSAKTLGLKLKRLDQPCEMIGVSGKRGSPITHAIVMHLWVNGRRFLNVPMLLADLGGYEMILGRVWLAENEIWLDVKNRRLVWPKERSQMEEIAVKSQIMIPRSILKKSASKPEHQEDADRRDRLLEQ